MRIGNFVFEYQRLDLGGLCNGVAHGTNCGLIRSTSGICVDDGRRQLAVTLNRHDKRKAGGVRTASTSVNGTSDIHSPDTDIGGQ